MPSNDTPRSDAEIVAEFMEPRPKLPRKMAHYYPPELKWWIWRPMTFPFFHPRTLTLVECHLVEEKLSEEQRRHYCVLIFHAVCTEARTANPIEDTMSKNRWPMIHASVDVKIAMLAAVIRSTR